MIEVPLDRSPLDASEESAVSSRSGTSSQRDERARNLFVDERSLELSAEGLTGLTH